MSHALVDFLESFSKYLEIYNQVSLTTKMTEEFVIRLQPFMFNTVCKLFIWFTFTIYLLVQYYAVNRLNSKQ